MIKRLTFAASALGLLAAPALHAEDEVEMTKGEKRLAEMLEGRVAGEPQNCINTFGSRPLTVIDDTALVYRDGKTLWVNRTRTPDQLDDRDYLVIKRFGSSSRLCRLDNVTTHDRGSNMFSGVIFLDEFVPYRVAEEG